MHTGRSRPRGGDDTRRAYARALRRGRPAEPLTQQRPGRAGSRTGPSARGTKLPDPVRSTRSPTLPRARRSPAGERRPPQALRSGVQGVTTNLICSEARCPAAPICTTWGAAVGIRLLKRGPSRGRPFQTPARPNARGASPHTPGAQLRQEEPTRAPRSSRSPFSATSLAGAATPPGHEPDSTVGVDGSRPAVSWLRNQNRAAVGSSELSATCR